MSDRKSAAGARQAELGAFLRSRRLALDPKAFDFPLTRRHVSGLRREEVASLAEISASWYAMLEQGRVRAIGDKTLARVAAALRLSPVECDFVADLARSPRVTASSLVPGSLRHFVASISVPAQIMNARFDLLAWNGAMNELFGYDGMPSPLNLLELLLVEGPVANRFADRAAALRNMVALLRAKIALSGRDDLHAFVAALETRSAAFRKLWAERRIAFEPEATCVVALPGGGRATFHLDAFVPLAGSSLLVIALTPRPAA